MPAHQGHSTVSRTAGDTPRSARIFHFSRISIFFKRVARRGGKFKKKKGNVQSRSKVSLHETLMYDRFQINGEMVDWWK